MSIENAEEKAFLHELYNQLNQDLNASVSMYDLGMALGLEKDAAGAMGEALYMKGYAELKTLSGDLGITAMGLEALGIKDDSGIDEKALSLGKGPVLEDQGRQALDGLMDDLKSMVGRKELPYEALEAVVIDSKTIDVQLLSPKPKTQVVREILRSISSGLKSSKTQGLEKIIAKLDAMIGS